MKKSTFILCIVVFVIAGIFVVGMLLPANGGNGNDISSNLSSATIGIASKLGNSSETSDKKEKESSSAEKEGAQLMLHQGGKEIPSEAILQTSKVKALSGMNE